MANYYQIQRGIATTENGRFFRSGDKYVAVIPFYLPKHGGINAWEFSGTKMEDGKEVGAHPKQFKAFLFSCAQAFLDFMEKEFNKRLTSNILKRHFRGYEDEDYIPPENYTGNPGDYIIIGGSSQRDAEEYPVPNHVTISYAHGDRPYYSEDGERFWAHEDATPYFSVIIFDPYLGVDPESESAPDPVLEAGPALKKVVSTIYYT